MGLLQMRFLLIIPMFISNTGVRATAACVESRLKDTRARATAACTTE